MMAMVFIVCVDCKGACQCFNGIGQLPMIIAHAGQEFPPRSLPGWMTGKLKYSFPEYDLPITPGAPRIANSNPVDNNRRLGR